MLSYKTIISKFMKIGIIPNVFPDHNGMIPEINNRIINTKFSHILPKNRRKENAAVVWWIVLCISANIFWSIVFFKFAVSLLILSG